MAIKSGYIVQRVGLELVYCPESRSVANESGSIVHKMSLWQSRGDHRPESRSVAN